MYGHSLASPSREHARLCGTTYTVIRQTRQSMEIPVGACRIRRPQRGRDETVCTCQDVGTGPCGSLLLPCGGKTGVLGVHLFPVRAPDCVASPPRTTPSRRPPGLDHPRRWGAHTHKTASSLSGSGFPGQWRNCIPLPTQLGGSLRAQVSNHPLFLACFPPVIATANRNNAVLSHKPSGNSSYQPQDPGRSTQPIPPPCDRAQRYEEGCAPRPRS